MFEVGKYYYISDFDGYEKWYKENNGSLMFLCDETDIYLCEEGNLKGVNTPIGIFRGGKEEHFKFFSEYIEEV